jgi:hypothetical protein
MFRGALILGAITMAGCAGSSAGPTTPERCAADDPSAWEAEMQQYAVRTLECPGAHEDPDAVVDDEAPDGVSAMFTGCGRQALIACDRDDCAVTCTRLE